jgi:DNA-binding NtrC family response regulator
VTYTANGLVATVEGGRKKGTALASHMAKSSFQLKVLYGEGDAEVLASQAAVIQNTGHQVTAVMGRKGVEEALKQTTFDLVILGPTLTRNDRHHLPYIVKKSHEGTRVLVMHTDGGRHPYVDAANESVRSIKSMVETIASMMAQEKVASTR